MYPEELRAAVAGRILALGSPFRASTESYEFVRTATRSPVHGEFAVAATSTEPLAEGRQNVAAGTIVSTELRTLTAFQVGAKDRNANSDAALTAQHRIRNTLLVRGWMVNVRIVWTGSTHSAGPDGWLWLEDSFTAHHAMPLA